MRSVAMMVVGAGLALAGCATTLPLPPTTAERLHRGAETVMRGTIAVQPLATGPVSLEFQTYADAVSAELTRNGYTVVPGGAQPQYVAVVSYTRANRVGPPRRSPITIGIGGGSFGGGRGGGVGVGGGVGFPVGGGGASTVVVSTLEVLIKNRVDQSHIWQGESETVADGRTAGANAPAQAAKLAAALFQGFPGESGVRIEVR